MRDGIGLLSGLCALLLLAAVLVGGAYAGCSSCAAGGGTWSSGLDFIGASAEAVSVMEKSPVGGLASATGSNGASVITARALFEDMEGGSEKVVAYVGVPGEASYIEGSIHLPLEQVFGDDAALESPTEIAALFGAAGITEDDPLVIYGDYFLNGYDTFAFFVMKRLGHEDVLLLDGTRGGREAAGLNFVPLPTPRSPETYSPDPNPDLLADDERLSSSQVVDARSPAEYAAGHPDGAVNIDYSKVKGPNGLVGAQALSLAFSGLDKDQPVVVYPRQGGASVVWYALYTQGYDVSLYALTGTS